jgi:mono/diheme cytochrome c family protein
MGKHLKWGALAVLALAVLIPVAVYLASEAEIIRRYTLPSSILHAKITPQAVARGKHLAAVFGCADCHGADMKGRVLYEDHDFHIEATDLTAFARKATDEDFDRAVRHGLSPRARALWVMPADSYVYMRNADLADIVAYIRSLPADSKPVHEPGFGFAARLAVLQCKLEPASPYALGLNTPLDVGPHWSGGRYLAAIGCSQCHASDLTGQDTAPDLNVAAAYSRAQFFHLMHGGPEKSGTLTAMSAVGGARFSALYDYETDALYDYLVERARVSKTLPPAAPVKKTACPPARKPRRN